MNAMMQGISREEIVQEKDVLGGGYTPHPSGAYGLTINLAYLDKADSGALGLHMHFTTDDGEKLRYTCYLQSGDKKGNKNYYERNGQRFYLPGFALGDSLTQVVLGTAVEDSKREERLVPVYSKKESKEIPQKKQVFVDLINKKVIGGVTVLRKNGTKKAGNGYIDTNDVREENEIIKFFDYDTKLTSTEKAAGETDPTFYKKWVDKWTNKVDDRWKEVAAPAGVLGMPQTSAGGTPSHVVETSSDIFDQA